MRIGIFSDVHGNLDALRSILELYDGLSIDAYACLGDVVGYGPLPDECVTLVRERVRWCVIGNHDAAVCQRMNYDYYYDAARTALDYHASLLSAENREWLGSRPYLDFHEDLCFSHGSPINVEAFEYIFNLQQAHTMIRHWDELRGVTFIGHSHLTKSFALHPPGRTPRVVDMTSDRIVLADDAKYIITVGSVGQPRDNDARACCTVYDTETRTIEYHRVDYDVCSAANRIFAAEALVPDFGKRLFLGV